MFSISFRKHRDQKKENNLLTLSKRKISLLAPSLRQQRALVLYLHRVIQTRFLTNRRAGWFTIHASKFLFQKIFFSGSDFCTISSCRY